MVKIVRKIFIVCFVCCIIITPFAFDQDIQTTVINIKEEKVKSSLKIAVIADFHSCNYDRDLISKLNEQTPDIIFLVGDIIDDELPRKEAIKLFENIKKYKSFYVTGNHEFWTGDINSIKSLVKKYDITVLDGRCEHYKGISICGIDDPEVGGNEFLNQLEKTQGNYYYSILIAHRPEYIKKYLKYGHDLIISGHAHGGQWRIPVILENGLYAPNQGLFPRYTTGLHQIASSKFIISRGLSKERSRVPRIFNRP